MASIEKRTRGGSEQAWELSSFSRPVRLTSKAVA